MASRIKGITIDIDGNATGLDKTLKEVNSQISSTQRELKDVTKLLKLDPSNVELLQQKQKYLNEAISETKDKLAMEKEALDTAGKDSDFPTDKMDALKREVIETMQELKNLEDQSKKFGSVASEQFKAAGEKMEKVGNKISGIGDSMTKNVTALIVAIGAASTAAFSEVDSGMDIVTQKTGASGQALSDLQQIVKDIATEIPTDFDTAGSAVGEVSTRFHLTGDALKELSTQFIEFASLNNTDVSSSIDTVQKALVAFNLDASSAGSVLDALNATGQSTGASVDTLAGGLVSNAAAFNEMGLSAQQAIAFMGQMEVSSVDTSTVMGGLQKALKNATADGIPLNQALSDLQNTIKNGNGSVDGLTAAYDLFGKTGANIYQAVQNGTIDFNNLANAATDVSRNVSNTFNETLDPIDQFQTTMNSLKEAGADVGNSLATVLMPALQNLAGAMKGFAEFWEKIPAPMQNVIVIIALVVAAIGPVLSIIGGLITNIGIITGALGALNLSILPIIAIIGAVIAVIILLIANWDTVKQVAQDCWEGITQFATDTWNAITGIFSAVGQWFSDRFSDAANGISNAWSGVTTFFSNINSDISNTFSNVGSWFSEKFNDAANGISNAFSNVGSFFSGVWDTISNGFSALNPFSWGSDLINGIADGIQSAIGAVTDAVGNVAGVISDWLHFSRPDIGPLKEYEKWMPDFMSGLAKGIDQSKSLVTGAMSELSNGMALTPQLAGTNTAILTQNQSGTTMTENGGTGDITIPVYIGNEHIDTIVVKASQRINYRSGGR